MGSFPGPAAAQNQLARLESAQNKLAVWAGSYPPINLRLRSSNRLDLGSVLDFLSVFNRFPSPVCRSLCPSCPTSRCFTLERRKSDQTVSSSDVWFIADHLLLPSV